MIFMIFMFFRIIYLKLARYSEGDTPVLRRKARVKFEESL
jgi:hypothetical protein